MGSRTPKSRSLGEDGADNLWGRLEKRESRVQSRLNSPPREGASLPLALKRLRVSVTVFCMPGKCSACTTRWERRSVSASGIARESEYVEREDGLMRATAETTVVESENRRILDRGARRAAMATATAAHANSERTEWGITSCQRPQ